MKTSTPHNRSVVILQPGYLPWLGFFDQLMRCDTFVLYDDVQFDKSGWRNRNRIKSPAGPLWLTVPVLHRGNRLTRTLRDIRIDARTPWARKHLGTIKQFYGSAPYFERYFDELADVLNQRWDFLVDLDIFLVQMICRWLNIERQLVRSSELGITGEKSSRLLNICLNFGARNYLTGDAAREYLTQEIFEQRGISVEWQNYKHPVYPQLFGDFVSHLSIIDLLFNCGPESASVIAAGASNDKHRFADEQ